MNEPRLWVPNTDEAAFESLEKMRREGLAQGRRHIRIMRLLTALQIGLLAFNFWHLGQGYTLGRALAGVLSFGWVAISIQSYVRAWHNTEEHKKFIDRVIGR